MNEPAKETDLMSLPKKRGSMRALAQVFAGLMLAMGSLAPAMVQAQATDVMVQVPEVRKLGHESGTVSTPARADTQGSERGIRCGDGFCNAGENGSNCPIDCHPPLAGACGVAHGSVATAYPTGNDACATGPQSTIDNNGNDGQYDWACLGAYLGPDAACNAQRQRDGACGAANNAAQASFPTGSNACAAGTQFVVDNVANDNVYNWNCVGSGNGAAPSCSSPRIRGGQCGPAHTSVATAYPTGASACTFGTQAAVDNNGLDGSYNWTCAGINGGVASACQASARYDGTCGTAHNGTSATYPTGAAACGRGTQQAVDNSGADGDYNWICQGLNGGGAASCIADLPVPPTPVMGSFSASPASIFDGQSSTLTWTAISNATRCSISGVGNVSPAGGSVPVTPTATTTYTLTCWNGPTAGAPSAQRTATVTVTPRPAPTISLAANPNPVTRGFASQIQWTSTNATVCSYQGAAASAGQRTGNRTVGPTSTTAYQVTCWNGSDAAAPSTTETVTLTVNAPPPPTITSFFANPNSIANGESTNLIWAASGAEFCQIDGGGDLGVNGVAPVSPNATTTYTLTCYSESDRGSPSSSRTTTVTVTAAVPVINSFTANPSTVTEGSSTRLDWSASNATRCRLLGAGAQPALGTAGSLNYTPPFTQNVTLQCFNGPAADAPSTSRDLTINVVPPASPTISIISNPPDGVVGDVGQVQLSWSASNATRCAWGDTGAAAISGSRNANVPASTSYTLTCWNGPDAGSPSVQETVTLTRLPKPDVNFDASPSRIVSGNTTTISHTATGADRCVVDGVQVANPASSSQTRAPTETTGYTAVCYAGSGVRETSASDGRTVIVDPPPPAAPSIGSFSASPASIIQGQSSTLSYSGVQNADFCRINGGANRSGVSGTQNVSPNSTTVYELVCFGEGGLTATATTTVTVAPPPSAPNITSFTATPPSITSGGSSNLQHSASNATRCAIDGVPTANPANSSRSVSPVATTVYTLVCHNGPDAAAPSATRQVTVTVAPAAPTITTFTASPASIVAGATTTLSHSASNATRCTINGTPTSNPNNSTTGFQPVNTTTYTLTCHNGPDASAPSATRQVTVTVSPAPVNGVCGSAEAGVYTTQPTTNLCSAGTVEFNGPAGSVGAPDDDRDGNDGFYNWVCLGANGGGTDRCAAQKQQQAVVNGVCGLANGQTYPAGATSYAEPQCSQGTPNTTAFPPAGGSVNWVCQGSGGGTNSPTCTAQRAPAAAISSFTATPNPVESGSTVTFSWASTGMQECSLTGPDEFERDGLNGIGSSPLSNVRAANAGIYRLRCTPQGGGASINANPITLSVTQSAVAGVCGDADGQSFPGTATSYSPFSQCAPGRGNPSTTAFPAAGMTQTWTCSGTGGGASSPTCSACREVNRSNKYF